MTIFAHALPMLNSQCVYIFFMCFRHQNFSNNKFSRFAKHVVHTFYFACIISKTILTFIFAAKANGCEAKNNGIV